ncbi:MAG: GTPase [Cenarchaeum symbiont of Oopsacas minuta]|nr:GTPase [Cenarchaeum symbiont of Oopsacas minuta]
MKIIFIAGTAGSGKSTLVTRIKEHYTKSGSFPAILNLDPGVEDTLYAPDIDIRDHIDVVSLMRQHKLGPNGALVMASDLVASKLDVIQNESNTINPDYLIVDTPGQIELFAYRNSGPYIIENLEAEEKVGIFMYDGKLITNPTNFVSISMLATSVRLRLGMSMINVLSKQDLITDMIDEIIKWSSNLPALENAIASSTDGESYSLVSNVLRGLNLGGLSQGLIPISSVTGTGMINLEMALSRIINLGEEIED